MGADRRAFRYLDLAPHNLIHIEWIKHVQGESLEQYANRIKPDIPAGEPFALMGLSFGGMVAVEVAKKQRPGQLIIISSIVTKSEMPLKYRFAGWVGLHKLVPIWFFKNPSRLTNYFFGARTEKAKVLLTNILKGTDYSFLKWAIGAMLNWKNSINPECVRIHGTDDHVLPIDGLEVEHKIEGGGHFMIIQKAGQLSELISQSLEKH